MRCSERETRCDAGGTNLTGLMGREQLERAKREWLDPMRAVLRRGGGAGGGADEALALFAVSEVAARVDEIIASQLELGVDQ